MISDFLTAIGLKKIPLLGGFLGALISLKFIDGIAAWSLWQRATTVASGAIVAAYCGPATVLVLDMSLGAEGAVSFIGGLFGMSLAGAIIKAMPEWAAALKDRIGK